MHFLALTHQMNAITLSPIESEILRLLEIIESGRARARAAARSRTQKPVSDAMEGGRPTQAAPSVPKTPRGEYRRTANHCRECIRLQLGATNG